MEICQLKEKIEKLLFRNKLLETELQGYKFEYESLEHDDAKTLFYTGLPKFEMLDAIYQTVKAELPHHVLNKLTTFQILVLTLMKLRLNFPFKELAYKFSISCSTASRLFHQCLYVLYCKLKILVKWPSRSSLWNSQPISFKRAFGKNICVILDCFEVFSEVPSDKTNSCALFSAYKHHHTVKFLIGIAPCGTITYISDGFTGRSSDKYVTQHSGILDHLEFGDIVMADRGFLIDEEVQSKGAELLIPAFTRGKSQLDPLEIEETRDIANVRIHVERVIGSLRQKYSFLHGFLPISMLSKKSTMCHVSVLDQAVMVACSLVNVCESVVPP